MGHKYTYSAGPALTSSNIHESGLSPESPPTILDLEGAAARTVAVVVNPNQIDRVVHHCSRPTTTQSPVFIVHKGQISTSYCNGRSVSTLQDTNTSKKIGISEISPTSDAVFGTVELARLRDTLVDRIRGDRVSLERVNSNDSNVIYGEVKASSITAEISKSGETDLRGAISEVLRGEERNTVLVAFIDHVDGICSGIGVAIAATALVVDGSPVDLTEIDVDDRFEVVSIHWSHLPSFDCELVEVCLNLC